MLFHQIIQLMFLVILIFQEPLEATEQHLLLLNHLDKLYMAVAQV
jgi:hypothetical protein